MEALPGFGRLSVDEFLMQVAAKTPTPGGGAVASLVGALAAALADMVVSYSLGKKSLEAHQPDLENAAQRLHRARTLLLALAYEDAQAYGTANELGKLELWDPRRQELPAALLASAQVPLAVAAASCDLLRLFTTLAPISNANLKSDLTIAAILAEATVRCAGWNVIVNLPRLEAAVAASLRDQLDTYERTAAELSAWTAWPQSRS